jgi:hypothetical protein
MDIKSILRTFRYTEMQQKADRDPAAKRPPTIKFLAVALFIGIIALGFSVLVMTYDGDSSDAGPLTVSNSTESTNSTTPAPTAGTESAADSQPAPMPLRGRFE